MDMRESEMLAKEKPILDHKKLGSSLYEYFTLSKRLLQRVRELIGNSKQLQKISDDVLDEFRRRKVIRRVT